MDQPLALPGCSDSTVILGCAGCTRSSLREAARALRGLSEQIQTVGQGAGLDPTHQEHVLPFRVSPVGSFPCPPLLSEKSLGEPRPPGLPHPDLLLRTTDHLPTHPSFLPGLSLPILCPQNGNQENPSCCGIDGILEAYHHSLRTVQLYGPTNFAPVVTHVARFVPGH